ncbi:GOLPH3/VPS74 family protein [Amycolatopsis anabasis]|uniref:GOLPH3/VPS74 family protein n=1 Tax=Amycolatopsis anabasis TaxID=1840409 RepID=UPI00131DDB3D|nr:GPP34 family phosphoprotein [Amycolatopsis anabasis]
MTELALPAKAYLLACDPDRARLRDRQRAGYLVRAAGLTDLLLRKRLVDYDGEARSVPGGTTGDDVLDEMLGRILTDRPHQWKSLVRKDWRGALHAVEEQLAVARIIRADRGRALGLFPRTRVMILDTATHDRLHALVDNALRGGAAPARLDPADAALTALVAAVELKPVVTRRDRHRHRARLTELEERGGAAVPALRKVFRELRSARHAAAANAHTTGS